MARGPANKEGDMLSGNQVQQFPVECRLLCDWARCRDGGLYFPGFHIDAGASF